MRRKRNEHVCHLHVPPALYRVLVDGEHAPQYWLGGFIVVLSQPVAQIAEDGRGFSEDSS